ncbi:hypothetical protein LCGC14_0195880 [marine sediment metagenome]|uniref:Uncharacterized protein n=1 Tax=marine sediment metagenome TaxID=412755 RepID=A0A0F9UKG8_9ZZZZ
MAETMPRRRTITKLSIMMCFVLGITIYQSGWYYTLKFFIIALLFSTIIVILLDRLVKKIAEDIFSPTTFDDYMWAIPQITDTITEIDNDED